MVRCHDMSVGDKREDKTDTTSVVRQTRLSSAGGSWAIGMEVSTVENRQAGSGCNQDKRHDNVQPKKSMQHRTGETIIQVLFSIVSEAERRGVTSGTCFRHFPPSPPPSLSSLHRRFAFLGPSRIDNVDAIPTCNHHDAYVRYRKITENLRHVYDVYGAPMYLHQRHVGHARHRRSYSTYRANIDCDLIMSKKRGSPW